MGWKESVDLLVESVHSIPATILSNAVNHLFFPSYLPLSFLLFSSLSPLTHSRTLCILLIPCYGTQYHTTSTGALENVQSMLYLIIQEFKLDVPKNKNNVMTSSPAQVRTCNNSSILFYSIYYVAIISCLLVMM